MVDLQNITDNLKEDAPKIVKQNKGALLGAIVGYLLTDNEKAKSLLLGAVAGSLLVDKNIAEEEE